MIKMRKAAKHLLCISLCVLALLPLSTVYAGPALDEILNYMYIDQGTPMTNYNCNFLVTRTIDLKINEPIGQVFSVGLDTEKIVRIRAYLYVNGEWDPGEGAEMKIWDSPQKNTLIGSNTIWYDFRGYHNNVAEFEFDVPVKPGNTYFLEISYVGTGNGTLCPVGVMNGQFNYEIMQRVMYVNAAAPPGGDGTSWAKAFNTIQAAVDAMSNRLTGQGYLAGEPSTFDLCFQTHGKRRMDRIGNLKKMFARIDLDRPEFAAIKQDVKAGNYEAAIAKTVAYFEARQSPVPIIDPNTVPVITPGYDLTAANNALQNIYFGDTGYGYVGPNINWRPIISFDENDNPIASGFTMNRYGPRGTLVNAYLNTGDHKYTKKLNDFYLDWFRDNPPPEASKIGGAPSDDVWSSLNAGIRLAAAFIPYNRAHTSYEFTTDCRMAYIMNLADHCDTIVWNGEFAGGNWSATQNTALLQFSLNFPEFIKSQLWFNTSCDRILLTMNRDILPDGVETESAPGYQRWMYYNPLVAVYQLLLERGVQTQFTADMKNTLEKMAEYFMFLSMPNLGTPELGDWGDGASGFIVSDAALYNRPDMLYVGTQGAQGTKPVELSKCYPDAGIVTMRSDWGDTGQPYTDTRYMMFHGVHYGSHGHGDLNGVTLYAYGRELLTDPGAYTYGSPEHNLLCKSESHNLMTVDNQDQGMTNTPFRCWATTPIADYLSSWIPGYAVASYHREVFYVRSNGEQAQDYWVIRDKAEDKYPGSGNHLLEQRWHFWPNTMNVNGTTKTAKTGFASGGNLAIMQVDPSRLQVNQTTIDSWIPRATNQLTILPTIIYSINTTLNAGIDTILFPYNGSAMPSVQLQTIQTSADGLDSVFKMVQGNISDLFILQRTAGSKTVSSENVIFNGERLFLRRVNGVVRSAVIINGSSLTVNGNVIVSLPQAQPHYAVSFGAGGSQTYTSSAPPDAVSANANGKEEK